MMSTSRIVFLLPLPKTTISEEVKRKIGEDLYLKAQIAFNNAQTISPLVIGEDATQKKLTEYREKYNMTDIKPDECLKDAFCLLETAIKYDHEGSKKLLPEVKEYIRKKMLQTEPEYSLMLGELRIIENYHRP